MEIKGLSLPYYLPIAGGIIVGFMPSSSVLRLYKKQIALFRDWTHLAVSTSYNYDYYALNTFSLKTGNPNFL